MTFGEDPYLSNWSENITREVTEGAGLKFDRPLYVVREDGQSVFEINSDTGEVVIYNVDGSVVVRETMPDFESASITNRRKRLDDYFNGLLTGSGDNPYITNLDCQSIATLLLEGRENLTIGSNHYFFTTERPEHLKE